MYIFFLLVCMLGIEGKDPGSLLGVRFRFIRAYNYNMFLKDFNPRMWPSNHVINIAREDLRHG